MRRRSCAELPVRCGLRVRKVPSASEVEAPPAMPPPAAWPRHHSLCTSALFQHLRFLTGRGESSENERISWAWRVDLRRGIHCKPTEIELSIAGLMGGCTSVTPQQQISRCRKQHICDNARKAKGHDGGATMRAGSRLQGGGGIDQGIASLGSGGAHRSSAAHAPPPRPLRG